MKNKSKFLPLFIGIMLIAIYNILYFCIPFNRELSSSSFWICYVFTILFILIATFCWYFSFNKEQLKSNILGITIFKASCSFFLIHLVFNIIILILGSFIAIPSWICIVIETILLAFLIFIIIARNEYRGTVNSIQSKEIKTTTFLNEIKINFEIINNLSKESKYSSEINYLNEKIKYQDPVSNDEVSDLEKEILDLTFVLKQNVQFSNDEEVLKLLKLIELKFEERKHRLKTSR